MSTPVYFDFSADLRPGEAASRIALVDVLALSAEGEERVIVEGLPVDLRPRKGRTPTSVRLEPGTFVVRLRTPEGRLMIRRVQISSGSTSRELVFLPKPAEVRGDYVLADQESMRKAARDVVREFLSEDVSGYSAPRPRPRPRRDAPVPRSRWAGHSMPASSLQVSLASLPGFQAKGLVKAKHGHKGVVKIQASPSRNFPVSSSAARGDLTSRFIGEISAVRGANLRGTRGLAYAKWKTPFHVGAAGRSTTEGAGNRYFAMGYRLENGLQPLQLACVPGNWKTQSSGLAEVSVNFYERRIGRSLEQALKVEVDDPELGGLLDFLQRGELSGSVHMLKRATELLCQKYHNPYASAAAGYVLVQAGHWQDEHPNWRQWLLNLAQRYTSLPDGAILFTTLMLQGDSQDLRALFYEGDMGSEFLDAENAALEAVRRGPPLFRRGLKMMATNLAILENRRRSAGADDNMMRELVAASNYVREMSLRVDPNQPFCVFDVRDE